MQSNSTSYVRERRGHDRVLDAVYLQVLPQGADESIASDLVSVNAPDRKVSISASGIYFADTGLHQPGTQITLGIVLFPSKQTIVCQALIIAAGDADGVARGELPTYRASFVGLTHEQTQILSEHVDALLSTMPKAA